MTEYICKEVQTDNGGYIEPVKELIRCRNCQAWKEKECNLPEFGWCGCLQQLTHAGDYCAWSPNLDEEKDEYVTLHHKDIHFIDEDAEKAFYESLEEKEE